MIWPTTRGAEILGPTRRFGAERSGHLHRGVDLGQPGDWVLSAHAGTVAAVRFDLPGAGSLPATSGQDVPPPGAISHGGLFVIVRGADLETRYMHLDRVLVREGQSVNEGQALGAVGCTGFRKDSATRAHLHFETLRQGRHVDPSPLLAGASVRPSPAAPSRIVLALGALTVVGLLLVIA